MTEKQVFDYLAWVAFKNCKFLTAGALLLMLAPQMYGQSPKPEVGDDARQHGELGVLTGNSEDGVIVVEVIPGSPAALADVLFKFSLAFGS